MNHNQSSLSNEQIQEIIKCAEDPFYFIRTYCKIKDSVTKKWIDFELWPEQEETLTKILNNQFTIALKARQLGLTWLLLAYGLWEMMFRPIAQVMLFSLTDREAIDLLKRLKGIYEHLPVWMQPQIKHGADSKHDLEFRKNGSSAKAFPTSAGDSYQGTLVVLDEADLYDDLEEVMNRIQPTVDAGGKLVLISKSDKKKPNSGFKKIYRAAKDKANSYAYIFLPWYVRPSRTKAWYEQKKKDSLINNGSLDFVYENYPETDTQALAPNSLDKRIAADFVDRCYVPREPYAVERVRKHYMKKPAKERPPLDILDVPGVKIYKLPVPGRRYSMGADPAEGNPNSDNSSLHVLDDETWEEVAHLTGLFEPEVFAGHIDKIGRFFNDAPVLVERNNHGHTVLLDLKKESKLLRLKGEKTKDRPAEPGHLTTEKSKTQLYNTAVKTLREKDAIIHTFETVTELQSIDAKTLKAPPTMKDDRAMSWVITLKAIKRPRPSYSP